MLARRLSALTALAFAAGAWNAHRLPARTVWGDVYGHVPNHLVTAGMALLVATSLLALAPLAPTARGRRARVWAVGGWGAVSAVFVVDAVGGGLGDRTGDDRLHDAAMLALPVAGLLLLAASLLLVAVAGSWALRLAVLASAPGTLALNEASSSGWLAVGLVAALAWAAVAVLVPRRPAPATAEVAVRRSPVGAQP